jgi:hypothetical protein
VLTQLDLGWFNLPVRHLYREALRAGDSIWWTPSLFSGYFVHGDGQGGAAHPFHLLLYRWLPLDVAFNLEISASYAFGFAGMLVLQRRLGVSPIASVVGAMLFAFSGFNLMHLNHVNAVAVMAHAPWMLASVDAMAGGGTRRARLLAVCAFAALLGSQILLGYPQYVWLSVTASAAFAIVRIADASAPARAAASAFALLPIAGVLGALVGAVQLLPHIDALRESSRGAMGIEFAFSYSLHPWNLVQFWSPYAFVRRVYPVGLELESHELSIYNGALCTAALAWLVVRRRELGDRRRLAIGVASCALLFTVMALGRYGGLYWLVAHLPFAGIFRAPARNIALVHLFLSLTAAIAFDDLARLARQGRAIAAKRLWPLGALVALSGVMLAVRMATPAQAAVAQQWSSLSRLAIGLAIVSITCAVIAASARGVRWAPAALIPIAALDLGLWGWAYAWRPPPVPLSSFVSRIRAPRAFPPSTLYEVFFPFADMPVLRGFRMYNGYVGMWPLRALPEGSVAAQRLGGVAWRHENGRWIEVEDSLPRARLLSDVRVTADLVRDIDGIDISKTALIQAPLGSFDGPAGTAHAAIDRPGSIAVDVTAPGRQLLVLTERFHSGWRARVDDRIAQPVRAYGDQLAVPVDGGAKRVVLEFAPVSVRAGLAATAAGCVLIGMAMLSAYSRGAADG